MGKKKFGAALNCIDGRVQIPVIKWMIKKKKIDYVDAINEPGMDGILASGDKKIIDCIKEKVMISVNAHDARIIAVVGHYDCAANSVDERQHKEQIRIGVNLVKEWNLGIPVIGLWVDSKFKVHVVK